MKIEARNRKWNVYLSRVATITAAFALAVCASAGSPQAEAGDHHFFNTDVETLEYPGPERFWNTAGIVISPARIVAQVNTEVPMFAGVCDGHGHLLPYEKVEWMLDKGGVGSFVTVSDAYRPLILELLSSKPHKIDNSYAVSETLPANVILTRGTGNIGDDMVMPHGYTWVTVNSPREGVSYVTAFAPDVYGWDARQRSATIHWIDAEWQFPEAGCVPLGSHASLNTCVYRKTNKTPLSDWIVKYTVTGGTGAGFGENHECSTEVSTDKEGRASVELVAHQRRSGNDLRLRRADSLGVRHAERSGAAVDRHVRHARQLGKSGTRRGRGAGYSHSRSRSNSSGYPNSGSASRLRPPLPLRRPGPGGDNAGDSPSVERSRAAAGRSAANLTGC